MSWPFWMSSMPADTALASLPPSTPSDSPTSQPRSERSDGVTQLPGPAPSNPASIESVSAAAERLLDGSKDARQIVRLLQCRSCSGVIREPITLPCGQSICRQCMPTTHVRTNISWPATANRLQGFECPFPDCGEEHAVGDCNVDVALKKAVDTLRTAIELDRDVTGLSKVSTQVSVRDRWAIAGLSSLSAESMDPVVLKGGRLVATYTMAEQGQLEYNAEVTYLSLGIAEEHADHIDKALFTRLKELARGEMDCQVCYALFLDPLTTTCGHTFCRPCVKRVLDHSELCPICRRSMSVRSRIDTTSSPSNFRLTNMITGFWADLVAVRAQAWRLEQQANSNGFDIPLFVCTLSLPNMPTFLIVFEARYRLMIRRVMEGDRTFGMVLHNPIAPGGANFHEFGTLLRIRNIQFLADGRSILDTVGLTRFRVTNHGMMDGYVVANIDKVDDISVAEEEAVEAAETSRAHGIQNYVAQPSSANSSASTDDQEPRASPPVPISLDDLDTMSTQELLDFATEFVHRMHARSVDWLVPRIITLYGECPSDPALFPWWFASILPVREEEKYRLLSTTSVRHRLKICCRWVVEWESTRWSVPSSTQSSP